MTLYVKQPKTSTERTDAAIYRFGEPLDDVLAVARRADPGAEVVEVPEWRVLLVRHTEIPDHAPLYTDYDVVEDGQMLAYGYELDVLYVTDAASFQREWVTAGDVTGGEKT